MDLPKIHWLTAIFLHLPVRPEALKAALGTAGPPFLPKGDCVPLGTLPEKRENANDKQFDKPKFLPFEIALTS